MGRCWRWSPSDWGIRGFISVWRATTREPKCASSDSPCKVSIFDIDRFWNHTVSFVLVHSIKRPSMYHPLALFLQEGQFPENPTRFIPRGSENLRCSLPLAPPTIKGPSETSEVSVVLGFSTQLPCDVEGSPTPSITWLKDNQPIVSGPRLTYTRGGQALRLGSAQGDSTGLYTCRATNPAGTAVKHYSLSVLGKMPPNRLKHNLRMFNYVFVFCCPQFHHR